MKTLPQILNNLRGLSALMVEQAAEVDELLRFFGGVTGEAAAVVQPPAPVAPTAPVVPTAPPAKRTYTKRGTPKSRPLTPDEKQSIRSDWELFPPHQRTATNRHALAAKYQVSSQHVFALTRTDAPLREARAKRQQERDATLDGRPLATQMTP